MSEFDWSTFTVRINIQASPPKLYESWATQSGIEHWFLRLSEYKKPNGEMRKTGEYTEAGDTYRWLWHGYPDETVETGEILLANGKDQFRFVFGKAGICTVKIYPYKDEQIVELIQDKIPTDDHGKQYWHIGCKTGWTFYLSNMKSLLEGGIDLRNRDMDLQEAINK